MKQKRLGGIKIREKPKNHRAMKLIESQMIEQISEIFKEKSI
jgi:hypothetical protein